MIKFKSENIVLQHMNYYKKQFRKKKIILTFLTNISTTTFT